MYRMIRAGEGYKAVIVVTPAGMSVDHPEAHCSMRLNKIVGDRAANEWHAISALEAALSLKGHTDYWGFVELPMDDFASLEDVTAWILAQQAALNAPK